MKTRINARLKPRNKTVKASKSSINKCTYKGTDGSINVSKYTKCIANDTLKGQLGRPKHIYEINDNAACPFVVVDYGGGRASIYSNQFNELTNRGELKGKLMDVKYEQLFLGEKNDPYWRAFEKGNNILMQTGKGKYLFVGKGILSFSCKNGDTICLSGPTKLAMAA